MYPTVDQLLEMLTVDEERLARGRARQAAVWRRKVPDQIPILLGRSESRQVAERVGPQHLRLCEHQLRGGYPVPEYHDFEHYTFREQFEDPEKMLIESLWDIIGWSRTPSDAQLSIRPNYGVGIVPSVFGCGIGMGDNDMPWVKDRPPRGALLEVDLDRLDERGLMPRVIAFIRLARAALKDFPDVHVYMPDLQGPMNTMFLLRQEDAFIELMEEPELFHRLMDVITEVYIRLTRRLKDELGEALDGGYHGAMYMAGGGARVVDDVSIMLSPRQYETFSLPYVRRCLAPFGGGWVHSCGDISHQVSYYVDAPEVRGVNFGEPQYYNFAELLPRFARSGTFCYGGPVREPDETVEAYFQRTAACVRDWPQTLIFQPRISGMDMAEGEWLDPPRMLEFWEKCTSRF